MGDVLQFKLGAKGGGLKSEDFRDTRNRFRTESLFRERNHDKKYSSYFTLSDKDIEGHISMRRVYLEISDPTEYQTAQALLGDFKHWQALCTRRWFREHLDQWRIELDTKLESEQIVKLRETAADPKSSSRVTAAKTLLGKPWRKKDTLRGRPSEEERQGYMKQAAKQTSELENDYKNVFGDKS